MKPKIDYYISDPRKTTCNFAIQNAESKKRGRCLRDCDGRWVSVCDGCYRIATLNGWDADKEEWR